MKVALIVIAALVAGCGPSCAERGGQLVLSHFNPVFTGKAMTLMPVYRCRLEDGQ